MTETQVEGLEGQWEQVRLEGLTLAREGRLEEAEGRLRRALEVAESFGELDTRLARSLGELSEIRRTMGQVDEAEELVIRSIEIFERRGEHLNPDVVPNLNNLGSLYYKQGKITKAEALFRRALDIWEEGDLGPHRRLPAVLFNLATVCRGREDFDEAARHLQRAVSVAASVFGGQHPYTERCRSTLEEVKVEASRDPTEPPSVF